MFRDKQEEIREIIEILQHKGASALVIELGRFIDQVPEDAIALANHLKFPIIDVPEALGVEFIHSVQAEIINNQTKKLEFSEKTLKLFTSKMALGGNIPSVLKHLSQVISKEIYYYDKYFGTNTHMINGEESNKLIAEEQIKSWLKDCKSAPIEVQSNRYGYILFPNHSKHVAMTDYEVIAIEHACTVIKLQVQKNISNHQIETNYRNEFVQELISDNPLKIEDMEKRASVYGWSLKNGRRAIIIQIDHKDNLSKFLYTIKEDIILEVKNHFYKDFSTMIFGNFSDYIVLLLEHATDQNGDDIEHLKQLGDALKKRINHNHGYTISIGIGKYNDNIKEVHSSYVQAKKAIELGRLIYGDNHTTYYSELGLFNILEPIYDKQETKNYCDEQLGAIIHYDQVHDSELFESVKVLSQEDWHLKNSAKRLFIHYNTMKYRVKKICELLNITSINSERKINIGIALKIIEMNQ